MHGTLSPGYTRRETEVRKKIFFHLQSKIGVIHQGVIHQALQYVVSAENVVKILFLELTMYRPKPEPNAQKTLSNRLL